MDSSMLSESEPHESKLHRTSQLGLNDRRIIMVRKRMTSKVGNAPLWIPKGFTNKRKKASVKQIRRR